MGETRVDLLHLLEDLRDGYPGSLEETILTEIVANSLDSRASRITLTADPARGTFTVVDDGSGMRRRELARYHDIAASRKTRGAGIGFAGVGIKLGLLASEEVLTETRLGKSHVATRWHLSSRHRAPWKWSPPPGLVEEKGTAVHLKLRNPLSPLLDVGFLEMTLRSHFQPLLDPGFGEILSAHYPQGVSFTVNGRRLEKEQWQAAEKARVFLRLARQRKPSALGEIVCDALPLPEERRGIAVSTFGKIIKRGWEWLGVVPANPERVGGLIEVPALAECLTLNKADFIRVGQKGAIYLAYRKAIQEAVTAQLAQWGDAPDQKEKRLARARPLERDLEAVVSDLAEDFPLLEALVRQHAGGQRRLPMRKGSGNATGALALTSLARVAADVGESPGEEPAPPEEGEAPPEERLTRPESEDDSSHVPTSPPASALLPGSSGPRRPARYGLSLQFESRPGDAELGRLVESTVWINEAHPAYLRAAASRSEGYHIALSAAMALASVAVDPANQRTFVTAFFTRWGEALERQSRRKRGPAARGGRRQSAG